VITPLEGRQQTRALYGLIERQKNLVRRYWAWELAYLAYTLVSVLSIGYLAAGLSEVGGRVSPGELRQAQLYLLIGSLLWGYLAMVFLEIGYAIVYERWEGTIEYTFMAPIRRLTHLAGICGFAVLYGLLRTAVVLVAAQLLFHLDLSHADLTAAASVLVASTPAVIGIGILASVLALLSVEKGAQMMMVVESIILLISGVYYPVEVLPGPLQLLGRASPLTYALSGIRESLLHGRGLRDQLGTLALLLAMGALLVPLGLLTFAWAERRAKRLGLLKRSG
jgi:ABC-2 type transport system permease protein